VSATYTIDELMCVAMAREIDDGDVVLEGIGTFLPTAAYELARASHAPGLTIFSPTTGGYRTQPVPLTLEAYERALHDAASRTLSYTEMVLWHLPAYLPRRPERYKEFLRPAQLDPLGNTNNVRVRAPGGRAVRLPGGVGIPDTMALHERVLLYLPRHDARVFVPRLEVLSGVAGDGVDERVRRTAPPMLITELGVFELGTPGMRAVSLHPGVTIDDVRERTPIAVGAASEPGATEPPGAVELALLRDVVDPQGLRELEFLPSRERLQALRARIGAA
jgi:acyl CoA:acetate/3-ketoacid CoA transferase beta subunit